MKLDKKRKLKRKTNYNKRLKLLKSGFIRLVIRKTNKYIILQLIESKGARDVVIDSVNTRELLKYGFPEEFKGSLKSIPAAYLGGYLLGKKSKIKSKIILDIGLIPNTKGSKIYSALKGVLDSGLNLSSGKDIFPSEEKINGEKSKINQDILNKIKSKIENG